MNKSLSIIFAGLSFLSHATNAAEFLGSETYQTYAWGGVDSRNLTLDAYAGESAVFYHDTTQVNLSRSDIDTLVDSLDVAVNLYRAYGDVAYPFAPRCANEDRYENTASATVVPFIQGLPAGLGCNGKGEVYKAWWNEDRFDNHPTDARTWEIAYYEMGRGNGLAINDYFNVSGQGDQLQAAFPRFVTWRTLADVGIDHAESLTNPVWSQTNVSPLSFEDTLINDVLPSFDFEDFYNSSLAPGGALTYASGRTFQLNDALAVVLYDLRERYGHEFMVEFFDFARKNASTMAPSTGMDAMCNIVVAGNSALSQVSATGISQNTVGNYLRTTFDFPTCSNEPLKIELNPAITHVVKGDANVISWNAWGSAPSNSGVQIFVDTGSGWKFVSGHDTGITSINYTVPSSASRFNVFIGLTQSGRWLETQFKSYTLTTNPTVSLNSAGGAIGNVGHGLITWNANFELVNSGFQFFGEYNNDGKGWVFLDGVDANARNARIPMEDESSNVNVFFGAVQSGQWTATTSRSYSIDQQK